jgi:hypothetical protein
MNKVILLVATLFFIIKPVFAEDSRISVKLPEMMRNHMMTSMRNHLVALEEITRSLAERNYDKAAEIAETQLGMSSLNGHGASRLGKLIPKEMGIIGTNMHRAASRFAIAARDAELEGGLNKAFSALSEVMQQCVACHSSYKVH